MQNKFIKELNKCLKQKKKSQENLKYITFTLRYSFLFCVGLLFYFIYIVLLKNITQLLLQAFICVKQSVIKNNMEL